MRGRRRRPGAAPGAVAGEAAGGATAAAAATAAGAAGEAEVGASAAVCRVSPETEEPVDELRREPLRDGRRALTVKRGPGRRGPADAAARPFATGAAASASIVAPAGIRTKTVEAR